MHVEHACFFRNPLCPHRLNELCGRKRTVSPHQNSLSLASSEKAQVYRTARNFGCVALACALPGAQDRTVARASRQKNVSISQDATKIFCLMLCCYTATVPALQHILSQLNTHPSLSYADHWAQTKAKTCSVAKPNLRDS